MKIEYTNVNSNKLHDELIANGISPLFVESKDDTTWVTLDDGVDRELVQQIIDAHDPSPSPKSLTLEEQLAEKDKQIAELKVKQKQTDDDLSSLMDFVITGGM